MRIEPNAIAKSAPRITAPRSATESGRVPENVKKSDLHVFGILEDKRQDDRQDDKKREQLDPRPRGSRRHNRYRGSRRLNFSLNWTTFVLGRGEVLLHHGANDLPYSSQIYFASEALETPKRGRNILDER